jgi:hypothetical protein
MGLWIQTNPTDNTWVNRLFSFSENYVVRTFSVDRQDYLAHLCKSEDHSGGEYGNDAEEWFGILESYLPERLVMAEISLPDLYATNLSKIGEVILNWHIQPWAGQNILAKDAVLLIRMPDWWLFPYFPFGEGKGELVATEGLEGLRGHIPLQPSGH